MITVLYQTKEKKSPIIINVNACKAESETRTALLGRIVITEASLKLLPPTHDCNLSSQCWGTTEIAEAHTEFLIARSRVSADYTIPCSP